MLDYKSRFAATQNYYFKDSVAYTEDHIPVQKLYMYSVPPEVAYASPSVDSIP